MAADADQLNEQARRNDAPLYALSNAQPIPAVRKLQDLFSRPAGHQALQDAGTNLANEGIQPATVRLVEGPGGIFRLGTAPTMPAYNYAKTALDRNPARLLEIMDGDGSGPRIPHPDEPAPRQLSEQAARLPAARRGTDVGTWTGQHLEPELEGVGAGPTPAAQRSPRKV